MGTVRLFALPNDLSIITMHGMSYMKTPEVIHMSWTLCHRDVSIKTPQLLSIVTVNIYYTDKVSLYLSPP